MFTNPCNANCITGFSNCFWTLPIPSSFINCPSGTTNPYLGSPDYYNVCGTPNGAHSGTGYAGVFFYSSTTGAGGAVVEDTYREYMTEKLDKPMLPGRRYKVSMWVRREPNYSCATQNIQMAFTGGQLTQSGTGIISSPGGQVVTMATDTIGQTIWLKLSQTVVSTGTYSYVTIGNFAALGNSNTVDFHPITIPTFSHAYYYLDDISIIPWDTLQVAPTPITICQGSTVSFTASVVNNGYPVQGPSSYTYIPTSADPSLTYNSSDHSQASVTPTVANTYSIVAIDGYGCTTHTLAVVNFTTAPNVTVSPNPTTICATNTLVLSASGANTYSWSTGATTSTVNVGPLATTIYTVTGYRPYCPSSTKTATVNVITPTPVTISGPTGTLCPGQSSTLTASGASSYTWSTGANGATVVVNPTVTTTYTVYATNPSCTAPLTATFTIKVLPPPQNLTVSGTNTICLGSSTTLSASITNTNSSQYPITWQPGSLSGSPVTVNPSATTVYTVKATDNLGCNLSTTKNYTVYVNVPANLTVNSATICSGQSATLTANGATSYTWQPGGQTTGSIVVSPTVTTSYTVTNSVQTCPTTSAISTVYIMSSPALAISPSVQYPCIGTSVTYSASVSPPGTYTYTWGSPLSGTSSTTTYSPGDNSVYTVTVSNTCGAQTASICVSVSSSSCCLSASTMSNVTIGTGSPYLTISGTNYKVYGIITITGAANWAHADFRMQPGSKIIVAAGASLSLSDCHFYSCADMWEGIVLQCNGVTSGSITTTGGTTIEDAYRAIYYDGLNTTYPGNITITNTTFNKNYIGLSVNNTTGNSAAQWQYLENCTLQTTASLTSPGDFLKCSSFYSPYIRTHGYIGYEAKNHTQFVTVGSTLVGSTFSNLDYGYYGTNSGIRFQDCSFSNMLGNNYVPLPFNPGLGIGIYAEATYTNLPTSTNGANQMEIRNCSFSNMWRAAEFKGITLGVITTNTITNGAPSANTCTTGCVGNAGFFNTNPFQKLNMVDNTITNCNIAMEVMFSQLYSSNTFSLGVATNTIGVSGTGTISKGIEFLGGLNNFSTGSPTLRIVSNKISSAKYGVLISNILNGLRVSGNAITTATTNASQGIRLTGTQNATFDNNTVTGPNTTNTSINGFFAQIAPTNYYQCNTVSNIGQCFVFDGNCLAPQTGFINNIMSNANDGLVLQNNGIIGSQGKITSILVLQKASGNQWNGTFNNSKTLVMDAGSSATNSGLVIRNSTSEYPTPQSLNKVATGGGGAINTDNYGTSATNAPPSMTIAPTFYGINGCPGVLTSAQKVSQVAASQSSLDPESKAQLDSALYNLTQGPGSDAILETEAMQLNQDFVYGLMDRGYTTNHQGLHAFYQANAQSANNYYSDIDQLIMAGNYTQADALNQSAPENTVMDYNQKVLNSALLKHLRYPQYAFTTDEINDLYALALKCPLTEGTAVYQARGLVSVLLNNSFEFTDNCQAISAERKALKEKSLNGINESVLLYPNPNNGNMTLSYVLGQSARLQVYDAKGILVYSAGLNPNTKSVQFSLQHLAQGIYYYTVIKEDGSLAKADKIVIIH
ncbi:MAG: T9SS type A sorting domain-containing protein [Bacteroidetes bacterium]|nr:T9SS type A sorting domain-containing protein [Bacteroidota bacterium]